MKARRYSITQRQAESLCAALILAIGQAKEQKEQSQYWNLRKREWEELQRNLTNYKWEVEEKEKR